MFRDGRVDAWSKSGYGWIFLLVKLVPTVTLMGVYVSQAFRSNSETDGFAFLLSRGATTLRGLLAACVRCLPKPSFQVGEILHHPPGRASLLMVVFRTEFMLSWAGFHRA